MSLPTHYPRPQAWGSRLGIILAVAGSAVGLGNFLRFPGMAAENGGGAFLIPYFIALILLGIPIGWVEWTMGRYGGQRGLHSAPAIIGLWGRSPAARFLGSFGVLVPFVVFFYYVVVESWCLQYAVAYASGGLDLSAAASVTDQVAASTAHFMATSGAAADGQLFEAAARPALLYWVAAAAINVGIVYLGISQGIERFCRFAMPAMAVCAIIVLVRVLTLGTPDPAHPENNVAAGLNFMWNPDFAALADFRTWLAAAGQVFFSLSVGFGVIINYASYLRCDEDVVLSSLTSSATNEFFEVALGGMITLTAAVVLLGLASTQANVGGTFSTGFVALPVVFARMPFGEFFGFVWFLLLFLAAITSSLSMLQPAKAFFEEAFGISHRAATLFVAALCTLGNLFVLWFSKGLVALDTLDFWVGTFFIFVVAGVQIICFAWVFGVDAGLRETHVGAEFHVPRVFRFIIKYVSPTFLLCIFVGFCITEVPDYVRTVLGDGAAGLPPDRSAIYAWLVILGACTLLLVSTWLGSRRWRAIEGGSVPYTARTAVVQSNSSRPV